MDTNTQSKIIAFVLYPGLTPLDLVGPLQALNSKGPEYVTVVVGETLDLMPTDTPLKMMADTTFADVPHPNITIVPGGAFQLIRRWRTSRCAIT